jgi:superfamily II DNA or RNA helicase
MPFDALPLVDVGDIIRLVGQTSFQRGRSYARSGSVHDVEWDSETGTLVSAVHGSLPRPYVCRVQLAPTGSALRRPLSSTCTCPVTFDCKHVAATLIEANSMYIQHAEDDRIQRASDLRSIPRSPKVPPPDPDWPAVAAIFDPELSPPSARTGLPPLGSKSTTAIESGPVDAARKSVPRWKAALGTGLEGLPTDDADGTNADLSGRAGSGTSMWLPPREVPKPSPMALQFELRELVTRRGARWGAPVTRPATPDEPGSRRKKVRRLGVRPVLKSASGNWVRGSLGWNSMTSGSGQFTLEPEQRLWFAQLAGLYAATNQVAHGPSPEWILLDDFHSPLLWALLEQAERVGVELVGPKKTSSIRVGSSVELRIDASTEGVAGTARTPAALQLLTRLAIDGDEQDLAGAGTIGVHGVYATSLGEDGGAFSCLIAPTEAPLSEAQRALFDRAPSLTVPGKDVTEFLEDYYPALRRTVRVTSDDASVRLPEFVPPVLVLTARFLPQNVLELAWDWEYRHGETTSRIPLRRATGTTRTAAGGPQGSAPATDSSADFARDDAVESDVLRRVETTLSAIPAAAPTLSAAGVLEPTTNLVAHAAAHFADRALPSLVTVEGLRIDIEGDRPAYQELTETPQLTIKTEQTDHRDWFDLGVTVTIEGRDVPFEPLFAALSAGADTLLLEDNSYLSLEQDVFADLKRLIDEASTLQEWKAKPSISRYQASLWSELEQLAGDTEQASAWRESVTGLLELESVAPVPLPAGIDATLRPYQQDGFNWLVFLWQHQLGGVLADDMGLGKTLQTLALITHAMDQRATAKPATSTSPAPGAPFLVVAPTSVVSNWVTEAARFAPGLTVRGVTTTQKKGRMSLGDLFAGADVIVTSYALFRLDFPAYQEQEWAGLILDEAQFAKNPASHANRCATELSAPFKLAITGTPMENSLTDLWSLFSIVAPGLFPALRTFTEEYVRPIAKGDNADLVARLRRRIKPLMLRRTKDLVAADLPAKQEQVLTIDLAPKHRKLYDTYLQRERKKLLGLMDDFDKNRFQVFRSLTLLRMLSLDASLVDDAYSDVPSSKLDVLFEQLEDVVAENHRALIFSQFTSFLKKAADRLDAAGIPYAYLDGSTLRRGEVIASFKEGDAPVFLISLKAGGFGLNLTEADYVFLLDPWWNPASESQAVDRTHRIGQNKSVMVYRMISAGTIEEKVMELKAKKSRLFDAVMDDDAVFSSALTADDIRGLLD